MCKKELPATTEYFNKDSSSRLGVQSQCKKCKTLYARVWREKNREYATRQQREYREKNIDRIKDRDKKYRNKNKEAIKRYQDENKDIIRAYQKTYREKHREEHVQYAKDWCQRNKKRLRVVRKKYCEENEDKIKKYIKNWKQVNRNRVILHSAKRRNMKNNLPATLTAPTWEKIIKQFSFSCAYCGRSENIHQEHFIPLSRGGEYTKHNIIPACQSCNCSKQDKPFEEWYPEQPFYSKERERFIYEHFTKMAEENGGWGRPRTDLGTITIVLNERQAI